MENMNVLESNYINDYTAFQMILPLDLEKKIDSSDPVHSFLEVMEGVNWNKYLIRPVHKGREEYNPFKMMKVILFAFMNQIYSLRKIEQACKTDIRFMYLMQEEQPSHMAFQRFIKTYLKDSIESIYSDIFQSICKLEDVDTDIVYIDGTKIEANANKFTFIWKKTAIKTRDKTYARLNKLTKDLSEYMDITEKSEWIPEDVDQITSELIKIAEKQGMIFVYGKGKKKTSLQHLYDESIKYRNTLENCLERIALCGANRNSCSKTDNDATMMHMKEDYYMKTGIFKAG